MERNRENYANIEKRNKLYGQIIADEPTAIGKKMVIVSCYWDQVAHSASLNGFYCGYQAAQHIAFKVAPFEGDFYAMTAKILSMERFL